MERRGFFQMLLAGLFTQKLFRGRELAWVGPTQDLGPVVDMATTYTSGTTTNVVFELQESRNGEAWTDMDTPCVATYRYIRAVCYT